MTPSGISRTIWSSRIFFGCSLVFAVSVIGLKWRAYEIAVVLRQQGVDDIVDSYADRLAPLKVDLNRNVTRLGYDQPEEPGQPLPKSEAWTISQYLLAPVVLTQHDLDQVTLVDCLSPRQTSQTLARTDVEIVKVYDKGVILVAPKGAQR